MTGCPHTRSLACALVPNQPKTPKRSVRVPRDLWMAAKNAASDNGETVTDVIIRALVRYVRENER